LKTACRPGTRGTTYIPKQCSPSEVAMLTASMGQGSQAMNYQTTAFTEGNMNERNKKFKMITH